MYSGWQMADVWSVWGGTLVHYHDHFQGVPWSTSMTTSGGGNLVHFHDHFWGGTLVHFHDHFWGEGGTLVHFHDHLWGGTLVHFHDHFWGERGVTWSISMTTSGGVPWSTSMTTSGGEGVPWSTSMTTSGGRRGYPGPLPWPLLGGSHVTYPTMQFMLSLLFHDHFQVTTSMTTSGGSHVTYPTMQFMLSLLSRHQNDGSGLVHMLI